MGTVAILGAGQVGRALGMRAILAGDKVRFGVRHPEEAASVMEGRLAAASAHLPAAAAAGADLILVAVPAGAAIEAVRAVGGPHGRIVVDCTNPLRWDAGPVWTPPPAGSVTQALAAAFPQHRIVKGFNHFGVEIQEEPALPGGPADALFVGDDADAKSAAMALAARMGFLPRDAGPLRNAGLLENLAVLWIQLATNGGVGREFSFRIETRRARGRQRPGGGG